jgi:tRNA pseudouridine synthase 10
LAEAPGYRLCKTCADRQGEGAPVFEIVPSDECFICGGLTDRLDSLVRGAAREARGVDFGTFGVGLSMPAGVQEREDELRSALRLKGKQTVKAQLSSLLSAELAEQLKKKPSKTNPDLTILIDVAESRVSLQSKSLFFYGRYTKPRGVAQRQGLCKVCWGKGCVTCKQTGRDQTPSVEEKVGRKLVKTAGAREAKFTWIGSEDVDSLVCGNGRPFVVELKNPRTRRLPRRMLAGGKGGRVAVTRGRILPSKPARLPTFKFLTRIVATAGKRIGRDELRELARAFRDTSVLFDRPNEKPVSKTVYRVRGTSRGKRLMLEAELDGGLPVKRFVNGDLVSPSISEVLKTEVRCDKFDVCRVRETGEFGFGQISRV